jgi:hypothetical protein
MKKYHTLYLMVRVVAESDLTTIADTVHEVEIHSKVSYQIRQESRFWKPKFY